MPELTHEQVVEMVKAITLDLAVPYDDPETEAVLRAEIKEIQDAGLEVGLE